ncbi:MAG TPA: hypothetical protein VF928_06445 [Usitatibacteraceae bacterium]
MSIKDSQISQLTGQVFAQKADEFARPVNTELNGRTNDKILFDMQLFLFGQSELSGQFAGIKRQNCRLNLS